MVLLATALAAPASQAQLPRWTVQAASTVGDCGDECTTPPTAWVYTGNGQFAFGVQCAGEMVLGGPAMAQPATPITSVEMVVDGRSYGQFAVQPGLADLYVRPTIAGPTQDWTGAVRPALAGGTLLQLWLGPSALLEFGLGGSRAALDTLDAYCAGGTTVASAPNALPDTQPAAPAHWAGRSWEAYSSISMAITGNITTNPGEIIFGNGTRLPWRVVQESVQGLWGVGSEVGPATVLQLTSTANPPLIEGNTLCGAQPTFVSLYVEPQGGLALTVYGGSAIPQNSQTDDVCAMYFYGAM